MTKKDDTANVTTADENAPKFARKARLTKRILSMKHLPVAYVKITGERVEHQISAMKTKDGKYPQLYPVIDLETGDDCLMVASAVMSSTLDKMKDKGVGMSLEIRQGKAIEGKKYRPLDIFEIEG